MFELDGVELEFEQEALEAIVEKAIERNTGARGLRSIIEERMRDIMYEIPSNFKIAKCIITRDSIVNNAKPKLVIDESRTEHVLSNVKKKKVKDKKREKHESA